MNYIFLSPQRKFCLTRIQDKLPLYKLLLFCKGILHKQSPPEEKTFSCADFSLGRRWWLFRLWEKHSDTISIAAWRSEAVYSQHETEEKSPSSISQSSSMCSLRQKPQKQTCFHIFNLPFSLFLFCFLLRSDFLKTCNVKAQLFALQVSERRCVGGAAGLW